MKNQKPYNMRINYIFLMLVLNITSCQNSDAQKAGNNSITIQSSKTQTGSKQTGTKPNGFWEKLMMHELRNASGVIVATTPAPASWKIGNGTMTGPHGIKATDLPYQSFMDNYDPNIQQAYAGKKLRSMPGIDQLIQQDIIPWGKSRGLQFVKFYEIPEISKINKWYSDQLYKALPSRSDVNAYGIDWKTMNGNPYFVLLGLNVNTSETMQGWWYILTTLEAEPAYFEAARKQFIFTLANTRHNLEPIAKYNKEEAQRCGQSWAAFNKKMAANQAAFEAHQIAHVNKSNAVNDAIMSNWKANNVASDKQQERTIDGIYERTNVQNTETGKTYKVQEGANQYWMNSNGEYIGTKLQDYNPNLDDNMNEQKWQELKKIK